MASGVLVLGLLSALVYKAVDFSRQVAGAIRGEATWNAPITQAVVWVAGVAAVLLAGEASFTSGVELPLGDGTTVVLGNLDVASRVLLGLSLGSVASSWNGLMGALDASRSTEKPALYEPKGYDVGAELFGVLPDEDEV
jgi:hypothetical protein